MIILVTGCCGFIGSHLCEFLLKNKIYEKVIGIDNLDPYYDVNIKLYNLTILQKYDNFIFLKENIIDSQSIYKYKPDVICHLASLAGVRNSINKPIDYCRVNIEGFINILEQCKNLEIETNKKIKIVFASSSSVYGNNTKIPFKETDEINNINSPYAASKKCMETLGQTYNQLYNLNVIALRFFTVYGPRGRPDMAPYKFIKNIIENKVIKKYGTGDSFRDYTYIDDIIQGIINSLLYDLKGFRIYNLGNNKRITLNEFIETCMKVTNKKAIIEEIENQKGDVNGTCADISKSKKELDYLPKTSLEEGLIQLYNYLKPKLL